MTGNVYVALEQMRQRPAMYLGIAYISSLYSFLSGFFFAEELHGARLAAWPPFELFNEWVATRFKRGETALGWCGILIEECGGDEELALRRFYELLDEFKSVQVLRMVQVRLEPDNLDFFYSDACRIRSYYGGGGITEDNRIPPPAALYIVQFSGGLGCFAYEHREANEVRKKSHYASYRAALQCLRLEFGAKLPRQELTDLSHSAVASVMYGSAAI